MSLLSFLFIQHVTALWRSDEVSLSTDWSKFALTEVSSLPHATLLRPQREGKDSHQLLVFALPLIKHRDLE